MSGSASQCSRREEGPWPGRESVSLAEVRSPGRGPGESGITLSIWRSGAPGASVRRRGPGLCCDGDFTLIRTRIGSGTPAWRHKGPPVETKDWESRGEPVAPCSSNITEIFWILDYRIFNSKLIQVENIWHFSCNANWISWVLSGILWFCIPLKVWHNNSCTIQFYIRW